MAALAPLRYTLEVTIDAEAWATNFGQESVEEVESDLADFIENAVRERIADAMGQTSSVKTAVRIAR